MENPQRRCRLQLCIVTAFGMLLIVVVVIIEEVMLVNKILSPDVFPPERT